MSMQRRADYLALAPTTGGERIAAALAHAGFLLGMPFVLPLGIWLVYPAIQPSSYVRHQAAQAMLFHLIYTVVTGAFVTGLVVMFFGSLIATGFAESVSRWLYMAWPLTLAAGALFGAFSLWGFFVMVWATYKAAVGEPYRMPIVGGIGIEG